MSKRSRRGNDYAPSTFPFLAVLLCVIGALVLLLVINVTSSRASATKLVQSELNDAIEQAKERSDYMVSISEELKARREQVKKQIESRRSELARTEDHIKRLEEQLQEAIDRLESLQADSSEGSPAARGSAQLESLRAKIDEEKRKLTDKIQQKKDQAPAFSIIPYDGANRTTRRPVYLECTQDGVIVQPEGVLIGMEDLGPPHGPGNPLDAALRVLRTAYQSRDAVYGITIPPYPLLLVRPDGIHSYALARSAMSGWDDQFGYELIDAEMPLAFPEGVPELRNELTKTLAVAKDRQRALVAALPARFSRNPFATKSDETWDSIDAQSASQRSPGQKDPGTPDKASAGDVAQDGRRWEMIQELPVGNPQGSSGREWGDGKSPSAASGMPNMAFQSGGGQLAQSAPGHSIGNAGQAAGAQGSNAESSEEYSSGSSIGSGGNQSQGSLTASSSGSNSASNKFSSSSSGASGGSANAAQSPEDAQMEQALKEQAMKEQDNGNASFKPRGSSKAANSKPSGSDSELKPISLTAGKDWATTRMDNKSTPVSRPIRIIVLQDRWLMCREGQDWKYDAEILLEHGPQAASQELQQAIRERVDSWGLSLPGGYWVPSLTVQAAADADQSVQRLQKLLEGSGVVIRVQPLIPPGIRK